MTSGKIFFSLIRFKVFTNWRKWRPTFFFKERECGTMPLRAEKHDAVEKRDLKNGTKKSKFRCVDTVTARNCVKTSPKPERFEIIPKRCEMKTETLGGVVWTQNPVLFRPALVPNLPYLKTVTLAAFRLIFFALLWGPSELSLTCQQILTVSCEHTRTLPTYSSCRHRVKIALTTIFRSCFIHISSY